MTTTQEQSGVEGSNLTPRCPIDQTPCLACGNTCMKKRIAELESQVFVPGQWRCAKCNFTVQKMTLDIAGDRVGVSDKDKNEPEKCPNGCGPLWRVTERDAGNRAIGGYESILSEIMKALDVTNYPAIVPAIDALRQPQAARLTDEDRNLLNNCHAIVETPLQGIGGAALKKLLDIIDRLTAAPAPQVTREEIAFVLWDCFCPGIRMQKDDEEKYCNAADAILSLLAERGLVKEG